MATARRPQHSRSLDHFLPTYCCPPLSPLPFSRSSRGSAPRPYCIDALLSVRLDSKLLRRGFNKRAKSIGKSSAPSTGKSPEYYLQHQHHIGKRRPRAAGIIDINRLLRSCASSITNDNTAAEVIN
jgi:hypothetical protein